MRFAAPFLFLTIVFAFVGCNQQPEKPITAPRTAALDPEAVVVLREALRAAAARGSGVLVATQDLSFAERVCDDVVLLSEGRVVADGGVDELSPLEETFLAAVGAAARVAQVRGALRDL